VTGFRSFNNSVCNRVLNLLEVGSLALKEAVVKRITAIKFGLNYRGSFFWWRSRDEIETSK